MHQMLGRFDGMDWNNFEKELKENGFAKITGILDKQECNDLICGYEDEALYRSRIIMSRHNFGRGEYKYFSYPLPGIIQSIRSEFFERLSPIANNWTTCLGKDSVYPANLQDYSLSCSQKGQCRPTPLILKYGPGDYNCLHQDLYGDEFFPFQIAICLSDPHEDFTGGEFVLTHQRPRMQSVVDVISLRKGDAVIFPVRDRPAQGKRGYFTVKTRHGVSKVQSGNRYVLGIIFHDAS